MFLERHIYVGEELVAKHSFLFAGYRYLSFVYPVVYEYIYISRWSNAWTSEIVMVFCKPRQQTFQQSFVWKMRYTRVQLTAESHNQASTRNKNFSIMLLHCSRGVSLLIKMYYTVQTEGVT